MKATRVNCSLKGFRSDARLYRLSPPIAYNKPFDEDDPPAKETEFVVVITTGAFDTEPETCIFPADEKGEILKWRELEGSFKGGLDHEEALRRAGYDVVV